LRFASLGSGSRGNALVVESAETRLLIDCGFGPRQLAQRLARLRLAPEDFHAIIVTHEHQDHASGVAACARRYGLQVLLTHGTASQIALDGVDFKVIDAHRPIEVFGLGLQPMPVPHDAREPVQFVVSDGAVRLAILTDAGCVTEHMCATVSGCDAIVIECNHDADMLANSRYPESLKRRIAGSYGHLENAAAAELLARIDRQHLRHVIASHLSQENNRPQLARAALAEILGCEPGWIGVAEQETGFDWRQT
jgi:phosphoribosyl 1,2-cyclic phosphodiesterase